MRWTAEAKALVAERLVAGDTAAQIGLLFDVNRSAITGLLARDAELAAVGFVRAGKSLNGGKTKRFTPEETIQRKRQYNSAYQQRRRKGTNVVPFPTPSRKLPVATPHAAPPALRVVSNNVPLMVQDWLDKNGGARKFGTRETTDPWLIREFLRDRGIIAKVCKSKWSVSNGLGRPRVVTWRDIMGIVDKIRLEEGLQPFVAGTRSRSHGAAG